MRPLILAHDYREAEHAGTRLGFSRHAWRYLEGSHDLHGTEAVTVYQTPCWHESRSREEYEQIRQILAIHRARIVAVPCAWAPW